MDDPLCKICGTRHRLGYCAKGWSAAPPKREGAGNATAPVRQSDHSACQAEIDRLTKRVVELEAEIAELAERPVLIVTEPIVIGDIETAEERKKRLNREKVARHRAAKKAAT